MSKYINADDYKKLIEREKAECYPTDDEFEDGCKTGLGIAVKVIDETPAADVVEVKHGKWETVDYEDGEYEFRCSNCQSQYDMPSKTNFCPNCGADMRGRKETDDRPHKTND